jgi:hypothetical protein
MSHPFREAVESKDLDRLRDALREDVVLHSPTTHRPFEGRDAVMFILGHVVEVFEDFRYTGELGDVSAHMLRFETRVGDRDIEGVDLLDLDESGKVAKLTVMLRPISGLTRFNEAMGERLTAAR